MLWASMRAFGTASTVCGRSSGRIGTRVPEMTVDGTYGLAPSTVTCSAIHSVFSVMAMDKVRPGSTSTSLLQEAKPGLATVTT